jgi:hypothetical protein
VFASVDVVVAVLELPLLPPHAAISDATSAAVAMPAPSQRTLQTAAPLIARAPAR